MRLLTLEYVNWSYYYYYYFTLGSIWSRGMIKIRSITIIIIIIIILNLGRSYRGGRQKLILEIIALMVNHPSGSHQQSSRAAG